MVPGSSFANTNLRALSGDQGRAEENNNGYEKYVIANATVATAEP